MLLIKTGVKTVNCSSTTIKYNGPDDRPNKSLANVFKKFTSPLDTIMLISV